MAVRIPRNLFLWCFGLLLFGFGFLSQNDSYLSSRISNILVSASSFDRLFVIFRLSIDQFIFGCFEELDLQRGIHNGILFIVYCFGLIGLLPVCLFIIKYFFRFGSRNSLVLSFCMIALFSQSGSVISPLKVGLLLWLVSAFCICDEQQKIV